MIKISIRTDKMAVVRFNHKTECEKFIKLMEEKRKDPGFPVKIKIRDERE